MMAAQLNKQVARDAVSVAQRKADEERDRQARLRMDSAHAARYARRSSPEGYRSVGSPGVVRGEQMRRVPGIDWATMPTSAERAAIAQVPQLPDWQPAQAAFWLAVLPA